jgi:hypothetical protein
MPAGYGCFGDNVRVERIGGDNLYMNIGFSRNHFVQIVVENAGNNLGEDNLYGKKALRRCFYVQIV